MTRVSHRGLFSCFFSHLIPKRTFFRNIIVVSFILRQHTGCFLSIYLSIVHLTPVDNLEKNLHFIPFFHVSVLLSAIQYFFMHYVIFLSVSEKISCMAVPRSLCGIKVSEIHSAMSLISFMSLIFLISFKKISFALILRVHIKKSPEKTRLCAPVLYLTYQR